MPTFNQKVYNISVPEGILAKSQLPGLNMIVSDDDRVSYEFISIILFWIYMYYIHNHSQMSLLHSVHSKTTAQCQNIKQIWVQDVCRISKSCHDDLTQKNGIDIGIHWN